MRGNNIMRVEGRKSFPHEPKGCMFGGRLVGKDLTTTTIMMTVTTTTHLHIRFVYYLWKTLAIASGYDDYLSIPVL